MDVDGKKIKLQIWDTAGQERFRTITATYYRGTHGVIVVYDVTDRDSFDNVRRWMTEIDNNCDGGDNAVNKVLVGNKADLVNDIKVSNDEARAFAASFGVPHFTTSAKSNQQVTEMFERLTIMALNTKKRQEARNQPQDQNNGRVNIHQQSKKKDKGGCC